jgi:hypothetical protein
MKSSRQEEPLCGDGRSPVRVDLITGTRLLTLRGCIVQTAEDSSFFFTPPTSRNCVCLCVCGTVVVLYFSLLFLSSCSAIV